MTNVACADASLVVNGIFQGDSELTDSYDNKHAENGTRRRVSSAGTYVPVELRAKKASGSSELQAVSTTGTFNRGYSYEYYSKTDCHDKMLMPDVFVGSGSLVLRGHLFHNRLL